MMTLQRNNQMTRPELWAIKLRGDVLLPKVSVRGFTPRTYGEHYIDKKAKVRDLLRSKIANLPELQRKSIGKKLWVDVTFYLHSGTPVRSRMDKDVDNLAKIVLDSLPEFMDQKKLYEGLGLILQNSDDMVFDLHATKVLVSSDAEEGIDIEIGEWLGS